MGIVKVTVSRPWFALGGISLFLGAAVFLLRFIPARFVPNEDQGMIYAILQTAPGSMLEYTFSVARQLQEICKEIPEIETATALAGYEIMTEGRGSNANAGQRVSECRRVELCVAAAPPSGGHAHLLLTLRRPLT